MPQDKLGTRKGRWCLECALRPCPLAARGQQRPSRCAELGAALPWPSWIAGQGQEGPAETAPGAPLRGPGARQQAGHSGPFCGGVIAPSTELDRAPEYRLVWPTLSFYFN